MEVNKPAKENWFLLLSMSCFYIKVAGVLKYVTDWPNPWPLDPNDSAVLAQNLSQFVLFFKR